jgi:hypothetical protein
MLTTSSTIIWHSWLFCADAAIASAGLRRRRRAARPQTWPSITSVQLIVRLRRRRICDAFPELLVTRSGTEAGALPPFCLIDHCRAAAWRTNQMISEIWISDRISDGHGHLEGLFGEMGHRPDIGRVGKWSERRFGHIAGLFVMNSARVSLSPPFGADPLERHRKEGWSEIL